MVRDKRMGITVFLYLCKQFRFLRVGQTGNLKENQLHKIWYPLKSWYQVAT